MNIYLLMKNFNHILLFKTNCFKKRDKAAVKKLMAQLTGVEDWNIDMDDDDRVLRIISRTLSHQYIINLLNQHGYQCGELT
ncbi:MAG: hypothetical protein V4577_30565 [Bacteroidota bacterium]